ncbi:hypothetical protein GYM75_11135 [Gilliamella sp. ESL0441]|uniref:hypothetical protein n=1 Tax=Gilliamella sp. ESL0441 TaxID=2704654 RepID=UPI001C696EF3|nr:hypothetical protein [Gilliamella sp. ESL0441]QYN45351.1 hypothetical protein GYM75_11135 [Gilliamella sp. ESL0441]
MNIVRFVVKFSLLILAFVVSLTACSSWFSNKGIIILDVQNKNQTFVTSQDLPHYYKLGNGEHELQQFETFCSEEIQKSQLDGSEEIVFENIKRGIHGEVEFKKCSDRITRIYRY